MGSVWSILLHRTTVKVPMSHSPLLKIKWGNVLYITNTSILSSSLLQVRSRTVVHGRTATGASPGQMNSPDTTGNTLGLNPSSASPAAAASHAPTTWPCTWSVTRINADIHVYTNTHNYKQINQHPDRTWMPPALWSRRRIVSRPPTTPKSSLFILMLHANISWLVAGIKQYHK